MDDGYEVIKEFECHGKQMVTVRIGSSVHVMALEDWHKVYGRNHKEKWKTKVDWNRFSPQIEYNKSKAG